MKHTDMSKLAQEIADSWNGVTHRGDTDWAEFEAESLERVASLVRNKIKQTIRMAFDSFFNSTTTPTPGTVLNTIKEIISKVLPQDKPLSPFGCKCWEYDDSSALNDRWFRRRQVKSPFVDYLDSKYKFCPFCGKPVVENQ